MIQSHFLVVALACLLLVGSTDAFGGFFGPKGPVPPVIQTTTDNIIINIEDNYVTMYLQLEYSRSSRIISTDNAEVVVDMDSNSTAAPTTEEDLPPPSFGWILPLPVEPTNVDLGSSLLFHSLFKSTLPQFELELDYELTDCSDDVLDLNCSFTQTESIRGVEEFDFTPSYLLRTGSAGIMDYAILKAPEVTDPPVAEEGGEGEEAAAATTEVDPDAPAPEPTGVNAVAAWLEANGYMAPSAPEIAVMMQYADLGYVFVAVKLNSSARNSVGVGSTHPLMIQYDLPSETTVNQETGEETTLPSVYRIPLRLGALAAPENTTLQIYVLSTQEGARAVPINGYLDVAMDDVYVDWVGCLDKGPKCYDDDYRRRVAQVAEDVHSHLLVTEYFGPTSVVDLIEIPGELTSDLQNSANWLEFFEHLENAGIPPVSQVLNLIDEYVPPQSFNLTDIDCLKLEHLYMPNRTVSPSMMDCFNVYVNPEGGNWTFDAEGLSNALETEVFTPYYFAQIFLTSTSSLTRLYGVLQGEDALSKDPALTMATGLPEVSHIHKATAVPVCNLIVPNALEITLQDSAGAIGALDVAEGEEVAVERTTTATTFWQKATLGCPYWEKTLPGPVFNPEDAQPLIMSLATGVYAHGTGGGGVAAMRDNETGTIPSVMVEDAVIFSNNLLGQLTGYATDDSGNTVEVNGGEPDAAAVEEGGGGDGVDLADSGSEGGDGESGTQDGPWIKDPESAAAVWMSVGHVFTMIASAMGFLMFV